ncbi:MAG: helix-turn-helix transcriptional regulator [Bacteroidota bacterium]
MKGTHLGEFEEIILLSIAALYTEAYGVAIKKHLEAETGRRISIGAVHAACNRLLDKGFLSATLGEKSDKRGGKRKKCYTVTMAGQRALVATRDLRNRLWDQIPGTAFDFGFS